MDSMPMHLRKHWTKFMHFLESKRIRIILVKLEKRNKKTDSINSDTAHT